MNLNGKSFLTLLDFTPDEITGLLDLAAALKAKKKAGVPHDTLRGKNIALIFEKTSTRTRCSRYLSRPDRLPDRQKGIHCRHGPRARPPV